MDSWKIPGWKKCNFVKIPNLDHPRKKGSRFKRHFLWKIWLLTAKTCQRKLVPTGMRFLRSTLSGRVVNYELWFIIYEARRPMSALSDWQNIWKTIRKFSLCGWNCHIIYYTRLWLGKYLYTACDLFTGCDLKYLFDFKIRYRLTVLRINIKRDVISLAYPLIKP